MYKRLSILGSTGSIGTQALDVVRLNGFTVHISQISLVAIDFKADTISCGNGFLVCCCRSGSRNKHSHHGSGCYKSFIHMTFPQVILAA